MVNPQENIRAWRQQELCVIWKMEVGRRKTRNISLGKQTVLGNEQFCVRHLTNRYFHVSSAVLGTREVREKLRIRISQNLCVDTEKGFPKL